MNLDTPVNVAELAELFGVHRHTVEAWVKDGLPASRGVTPGTPVLAQLRAAVRWVRERDAKRAEEALEKAREGDPDSSKARKLAAEARLKELTVAEREGQLVPADEVEAAWQQQTAAVREAVMSVSAVLVQAGVVQPQDEAKAEAALRDALVTAADQMTTDMGGGEPAE